MKAIGCLRGLSRPGGARWLLAALALPVAVAAMAGGATLAVVDASAHYPEGPLWHDGAFYFVEYSTGAIRRKDADGIHDFWRGAGCGPSGLAELGHDLLVACYDGNKLLQLDARASLVRTLDADVQGKPFTGPNDFAPDGHGGVYFSASGVYDVRAPITGAVYHLPEGSSSIERVAGSIHYPNGLALSRDGRELLVAEMLAGRVLAFEVGADGALGARRVWKRMQDIAPPAAHEDAYTGPDGIKLGADGNYYIAQNGSGRVLVVAADGALVRQLRVPTRYVTNVAIDPADPGSIYITGTFDEWRAPYPGAVYRWHR